MCGQSQHCYLLTCNTNVLDLLLLTSDDLIVDNLHYGAPFSTSDQITILFKYLVQNEDVMKVLKHTSRMRDLRKSNFFEINKFLNSINWDFDFSSCLTIDDYWFVFTKVLSIAINRWVPFKKVYKGTTQYPSYIMRLLRRKNVLWDSSFTHNGLARYKLWASKCRNKIVSFITNVNSLC